MSCAASPGGSKIQIVFVVAHLDHKNRCAAAGHKPPTARCESANGVEKSENERSGPISTNVSTCMIQTGKEVLTSFVFKKIYFLASCSRNLAISSGSAIICSIVGVSSPVSASAFSILPHSGQYVYPGEMTVRQ